MNKALVIFALLMVAVAQPSGACPACSGTAPNDSNNSRTALVVSTAGMIALPLAMVTGLGYWLYRRR